MADRAGRFGYIDGLRGIAALMVIAPHSTALFAFPEANALSRGFNDLSLYGARGVQLFFVISGFAISYSLRNATRETFGLGRFVLRRSVRLDPPYWCGIFAMWAATAIQSLLTHRPISRPGVSHLLAHLFYLQGILGYPQINPVYWTLCVEFQLYVVFAIFLLVTERLATGDALHKMVRPAILIAGFVASVALAPDPWPRNGIEAWLVPYWYMFGAGVLVCWQMLGRVSRRQFFFCFVLMVAAYARRPDSIKMSAILAAAFIQLGMELGKMRVWLSGRIAQLLGRLSYSIYLLHIPVAVLVFGLRTRVASTSNLVAFLMLGVIYAVTIGASFLLNVLVEAPCQRLSERLKGWPAWAPGLQPLTARRRIARAARRRGALPAAFPAPEGVARGGDRPSGP
jgi:peptidoglycan/LPS O-acetylase OafA/YrhL